MPQGGHKSGNDHRRPPAYGACHSKGTGDLSKGGDILTGRDLDAMSDDEFARQVEKVSVYARVSTEAQTEDSKSIEKSGTRGGYDRRRVNDAPRSKRLISA
jgi:Ca2+-transporting ATPase